MQIKYTVYHTQENKVSKVDIWKTDGEMIHPVYEREHHILPQNVTSRGYIYFNPLLRCWALEHYQMDDGVPARNLMEFVQRKRLEKKDRLLVKKTFHYTDFAKDEQLKIETWKDKKKITWATFKYSWGIQNN